eukprot:gene15190-21265_t
MELIFFDNFIGNLDWSVRTALAHLSIAITVVEFGALLIHSFSLLFLHTTCIPENDEESSHPGGAFLLSFSHPLLALFSFLDKSPIMAHKVSSCQDHLAENFLDVALISSLVVGLISSLVDGLELNIVAAYREFVVGATAPVPLINGMPPSRRPSCLPPRIPPTDPGHPALIAQQSRVDVMGIQLPSFILELPLILLLALTVFKKLDGSDHQLMISVNEVSAVMLVSMLAMFATMFHHRQSLFLLDDTVDLRQMEADEAYAARQLDLGLLSDHKRRPEETGREVISSRQPPISAARGATAHERAGKEPSIAAGQETELVPYVSSESKAPDSEMQNPLKLDVESLCLEAAMKMVVREQKTRLKKAAAMEAEGSRVSDTGAEKSSSGFKVTQVSSEDMITPAPETSESTTTPTDSDSSSTEIDVYTGKGGFVSVCARVALEHSCQETALAKASELITEAIHKFGLQLKSPPLHIEELTLSRAGGRSASSGSSGNNNPKSVPSGGIEGSLLVDIIMHAIYGPPFLAEVGCDPADMRPEVNAAAAAGLRADIAEKMLTETLFQTNHVADPNSLIVTMGPAPIYGPHHHFRLAAMSTVSVSDQAEDSGTKPGSSRDKETHIRSDSRARARAHAGASTSTTGASTAAGVGGPTMAGASPSPYDKSPGGALQTLDLVGEMQQAEGGGMALLMEEPAVVDMRLQTGEAGMLGHLEDAGEAEEADRDEYRDMPSYGSNAPGSHSKSYGLRDEEIGGVMRCDEEHRGGDEEESDEEDMPCNPAQVWCSGGSIEGPAPDRCYLNPVALPQFPPVLGISTRGASSTQKILVITDFLGMVDTFKGHMQLLVTQSGSVLRRQTLSHADFKHGVCTIALPASGLDLGTLFCHLIFSKTPYDEHATKSDPVSSGSQGRQPTPQPTPQPEKAKPGVPEEPDGSATKEGAVAEIPSSGGAAAAAGVPSVEDETKQGVRFVASLPLLCLPDGAADGAAGEMRTLFEKMVRKTHSQLRRIARKNAISGPAGTRSTAEAGAAATGVGFFTPVGSSEGSPEEYSKETAEPGTETSDAKLRFAVPWRSSLESPLFVPPSKGVPQAVQAPPSEGVRQAVEGRTSEGVPQAVQAMPSEEVLQAVQATAEEEMQAVEAASEDVSVARKISAEEVPDALENAVQAVQGVSTTDVQAPLAATLASPAPRLEEATPNEALVHQMERSGLNTRADTQGDEFEVPEYHEESPRSSRSAEEGEARRDLEEKAEYAERVSAYQEADDAEIDKKGEKKHSSKAKAKPAKSSLELVTRFDVIRCRAYQEHFCPLAADLQCILSLGSLRDRIARDEAEAPTPAPGTKPRPPESSAEPTVVPEPFAAPLEGMGLPTGDPRQPFQPFIDINSRHVDLPDMSIEQDRVQEMTSHLLKFLLEMRMMKCFKLAASVLTQSGMVELMYDKQPVDAETATQAAARLIGRSVRTSASTSASDAAYSTTAATTGLAAAYTEAKLAASRAGVSPATMTAPGDLKEATLKVAATAASDQERKTWEEERRQKKVRFEGIRNRALYKQDIAAMVLLLVSQVAGMVVLVTSGNTYIEAEGVTPGTWKTFLVRVITAGVPPLFASIGFWALLFTRLFYTALVLFPTLWLAWNHQRGFTMWRNQTLLLDSVLRSAAFIVIVATLPLRPAGVDYLPSLLLETIIIPILQPTMLPLRLLLCLADIPGHLAVAYLGHASWSAPSELLMLLIGAPLIQLLISMFHENQASEAYERWSSIQA